MMIPCTDDHDRVFDLVLRTTVPQANATLRSLREPDGPSVFECRSHVVTGRGQNVASWPVPAPEAKIA
jgi:hypothetical protein